MSGAFLALTCGNVGARCRTRRRRDTGRSPGERPTGPDAQQGRGRPVANPGDYPVLEIVRVGTSARDSRPIEVTMYVIPSDRVEQVVILERDETAALTRWTRPRQSNSEEDGTVSSLIERLCTGYVFGGGRWVTTAERTDRDFFISYAGVNRPWAEWIAVELERVGYSTLLQAWDFRPGTDFMHKMQEATTSAKRTIAVLSPAYFASDFSEAEWRSAFVKDPTGEIGLLVPVRVQPCRPPGLLASRVYVDLVAAG